MDASTPAPNATSSPSAAQAELVRRLYLYSVPLLVAFCVTSIAVNARVLLAVCWIRRPLSPTLYISLSLAGADAYTSFLYGLHLVVHSLLPTAWGVNIYQHYTCLWMTLEVLRLSGVIVGVMHLLALAGNHYLGIRRPLHYASIMTHANTTACIVLLWLLPTLFFFAYFSSVPGEAFQSRYCEDHSFITYRKFRVVFSSLFFTPLAVMLVIYAHIFAIVRRHQAHRLRFSRGSRHGDAERLQQRQRQISGAVKAVHTTLLILGSFVVGWLPAVTVFVLVCYDCAVTLDSISILQLVPVNTVVNLLVICKTLLNPIIYAARMQEIKIAIRLMNMSLCHCCCPNMESHHDDLFGNSDYSQHYRASTLGRNSTHLHRARTQHGSSNGSVAAGQDATQTRRASSHKGNSTTTTTDL
ncbi:trace amine-associated receptor 3-like [Bacillus rossius redtenbacheri]|uniref:trace amine-associated receptor 3-like n=1 Tax=Bacillus rossius redtenbacheri TaxID=93214 RepID=UPI002FDD375B